MPVRFSDAEENLAFREACEAVQRSAAGKDMAEIRQLLTDEFRSRDILVPPPVIGLTAASIAAETTPRTTNHRFRRNQAGLVARPGGSSAACSPAACSATTFAS
jgi:hypothetical protein